MPLDLFRSRQFSGANLVTFLIYGGMAGLFFLLVVYLQDVAGYSPILAGSALVPVTLLMLVLSVPGGRAVGADRSPAAADGRLVRHGGRHSDARAHRS